MLYLDMMRYSLHTCLSTSRETPLGLPTFSEKTPMLRADKYIT